MPKGVEHLHAALLSVTACEEFLPLMPKGVEHICSSGLCSNRHIEFLPLMPKGVEHMLAAASVWVVLLSSFR